MEQSRGPTWHNYESLLNAKVAIHCPTQEDWDAVNSMIIQHRGDPVLKEWWRNYSEDSHITIVDHPTKRTQGNYCNSKFYLKEGYTIITAQQFLQANRVDNYDAVTLKDTKTAIACPTAELYDQVRDIQREKLGGACVANWNQIGCHEDTCLNVDGTAYCNKEYYKKRNYTIIPAQDYITANTPVQEYKVGMWVVVTGDGSYVSGQSDVEYPVGTIAKVISIESPSGHKHACMLQSPRHKGKDYRGWSGGEFEPWLRPATQAEIDQATGKNKWPVGTRVKVVQADPNTGTGAHGRYGTVTNDKSEAGAIPENTVLKIRLDEDGKYMAGKVWSVAADVVLEPDTRKKLSFQTEDGYDLYEGDLCCWIQKRGDEWEIHGTQIITMAAHEGSITVGYKVFKMKEDAEKWIQEQNQKIEDAKKSAVVPIGWKPGDRWRHRDGDCGKSIGKFAIGGVNDGCVWVDFGSSNGINQYFRVDQVNDMVKSGKWIINPQPTGIKIVPVMPQDAYLAPQRKWKVGSKFKYKERSVEFTIAQYEDPESVEIQWNDGKDSVHYNPSEIDRYFNDGTWILIEEEPVPVTLENAYVGMRVVVGKDWRERPYDKGVGIGVVCKIGSLDRKLWVEVDWDTGQAAYSYRAGDEGKYELNVYQETTDQLPVTELPDEYVVENPNGRGSIGKDNTEMARLLNLIEPDGWAGDTEAYTIKVRKVRSGSKSGIPVIPYATWKKAIEKKYNVTNNNSQSVNNLKTTQNATYKESNNNTDSYSSKEEYKGCVINEWSPEVNICTGSSYKGNVIVYAEFETVRAGKRRTGTAIYS